MNVWLVMAICAAGAAVLVFAALLAAALCIRRIAFGGRFDRSEELKYFSAEDFGLDAVPVFVRDGRTELRGRIYRAAGAALPKALVIFSHGMGPGQCAYTTEIAYFCRHGFAVLALDCAGCGLSDGRGMRGMEASTRALVAAAKFARGDARLKNLTVFYAGHSMGAYSALCAAAFVKPAGVAAFSAPERPSLMIKHRVAAVAGSPFACVLHPFVRLAARLQFGRYGDLSASRKIEESGVPAMLFHGDADEVVPLGLSAFSAAEGEGIEHVPCRGKGHNPYNTFAAEKLLSELASVLKGGDMGAEERAACLASVDYRAVCEEDGAVMGAALEFFEREAKRGRNEGNDG